MAIVLPIEIGDVILTGRFKNKKLKVKEITLDKNGHPLVNGKGILKVRIPKLVEKARAQHDAHQMDTVKKIAKKIIEKTSKVPKAIETKVKKLNDYIQRSNKDDIYAIEPDSTWESIYEFKPITIKGNFLYIEYIEPMNNKKKNKDRYNLNNEYQLDEAKYALNWVLRALKKGYRAEGKTL